MKFHVVDIDGFQIQNPEFIQSDGRHFFIDSDREERVEGTMEPVVSIDAYAARKIVVKCSASFFVLRRLRERSSCVNVARKIILNQSDD